jgi:hypothetical protein
VVTEDSVYHRRHKPRTVRSYSHSSQLSTAIKRFLHLERKPFPSEALPRFVLVPT